MSSHSRRRFLGHGAALLAMASAGPLSLQAFAPDKARRVALIGTGWYGKSDLFRLMQIADIDIVGLCDPDKNQLNEAVDRINTRRKSTKPIPTYGKHEDLLKAQKPDIVLIGSPDHWHALQAIDAIKSGADVYLQKPISVDVMEGEAILAAARKYGRVVQVGTQRRSTHHLVEAKKNIIEAGLLGKVHHVEMFCYYHMRNTSNPPLQPVPEFLDYERWTGPAPLRPYDGLPHRGWWRAFMEYGNGIMGDMCIHMFDAVRWMLDLGWPTRVDSTGGIFSSEQGKCNTADTQTATFEYPGLTCVWQHRSWGTPPDPDYPWGFKIYGEKGTLCGSVMRYDFIPEDGGKVIHGDVLYEKEKYPEDLNEEDIELHCAAATRAHMRNFLTAIDKRSKPVADIEQGHVSTASCIMANMSMKLGRPLRYDPIKRIVVGDEEATRMLSRPYRSPWKHPDPESI